MAGNPEPALDMSEIIDLYKEDARRMVAEMRIALQQWNDVCAGGPARKELRRLSHQLRGSGRTYGFRNVTRVSKAMENIIFKLEKQALKADDRLHQAITNKINRLDGIFHGL